jgi:hypothetical protein
VTPVAYNIGGKEVKRVKEFLHVRKGKLFSFKQTSMNIYYIVLSLRQRKYK